MKVKIDKEQLLTLKNMINLSFQDTYDDLYESLSYDGVVGTKNKINLELQNLPNDYFDAVRLYVIAKNDLQQIERDYLYNYNLLVKEVREELNRKKNSKIITGTITEKMIENEFHLKNSKFYNESNDQIEKQKLIVKACEFLIKSLEMKKSTLSTISKNLEIQQISKGFLPRKGENNNGY